MSRQVALRLPLHGAALLDRRRAGVHPPEAHVVVGGEPRATVRRQPAVWVGEQWRAGLTDWRMLAGLPVSVWCAVPFGAAAEDAGHDVSHPLGWAGLVALVGEVSRLAAPVRVLWRDLHWADCGSVWVKDGADAAWLAESCRREFGGWPVPWSEQLMADYERRVDAWLSAPLPLARAA